MVRTAKNSSPSTAWLVKKVLAKESQLRDAPTLPAGQTLGAATITQPRFNEKVENEVRAISSVGQILTICSAMFDPSSERNVKNGIIAERANDAPPYPPKYLEDKGQSWRHNASTGFLSSILGQAITRPVDIIDAAQYLTSASLDQEDDPDGSKTEAYRRKFTKRVRSWDGFRTHIYNLANEDVTYGYASSVCDDPDDWRPEECRQDEFGVPDNTGQNVRKCQFFARKKSFLISDFCKKIRNKEAAEFSGYYIDRCVEALNESMPQDQRSTGSGSQGPTSRSYSDLMRDGNSGASHDPKATTVDVYILLAVEDTGKVSKYMVTQKGDKLLYEHEDEFESLPEILTFYSLEPGTGTLYSSKGGGRRLINLAIGAERSRNKAMDHDYISSLIWMWSEKGMVAVQMKVFDNFGIIGSEAKAQPDALPDRSENFDKADERNMRYAEQAFGAYITQKPSEENPGQPRTAHEVALDAQQAQQAQSAWLKRFFGQFGDEMTIIARRLGNPKTSDEEAKEWQKDLEESDGITPDLLKKLVNQPQGQLIDDMTQARTSAMLQSLPMVQASSYWDHYGYERELSVRVLGKEITEKYMFPNGLDPRKEASEINKQELESGHIRNGNSINVDPTSNHMVHSKYIVGEIKQAEPEVAKKVLDGSVDPAIIDNLQALKTHGAAHVQMGMQDATQRKDQKTAAEFAQHQKFYDDFQTKLDGALKHLAALKKAKASANGQKPPALMAPGAPAGAPTVQPPQPTSSDGQVMYDKMTEGVFKVLVGHYDIVPDDIKRQIETLCGLQQHNPNTANGTAAPPVAPPPAVPPDIAQPRVAAPVNTAG